MEKILKTVLLILIFSGAFLVRLYKINSPLADWHSWRQVDTAAVARNYVKYGINLLKPQYDDLSNVASGRENPQGLRLVEFPLYSGLHALVYRVMPILSFETWGRLLTVFSSLVTMAFIFLLTKKYAGWWPAFFATFFYGYLPYSIYYGRVILPEPTMVMCSMGSLWFASRFAENKRRVDLMMTTVFFAVALLIKPTAIFFGLPIVYLLLHNNNRKYGLYLSLLTFIFSFLPLLLWRLYIRQFPEGIPASSWLLNGDGIRLKGAWFRWLFGERIAKLMLGYWGVVFFTFGIFWQKIKRNLIFEMLGLSSLLYLIVFATGNVRHDYYQILIIPTVSIYCGAGLAYLLHKKILDRDYPKLISIFLTLLLLFLTFSLSWYEVKGFFNINHPEIVEAGKKVDQIVPKDAKVIAPYGGDTAFLYQTNRRGWPLLYNTNDVTPQIKLGATHYVSVNYDDPTKKIMQMCHVMYQNEKFVVVELKCK